MSNIQLLKALVNERLCAAAEEIFEAVKRTMAGYEEELVRSRREIRRQRRMLRSVEKRDVKISKCSDQPQLAMSVWDEDSPSDQQQVQKEVPYEPDCVDQRPSSHGEEQLQELEDNAISFIFTPLYASRGLDQLQPSFQSIKAGGGPLPSTSAEQDKTKTDGNDKLSSYSSAEDNNGDKEWRASTESLSQDSDKDKWKTKEPQLPMAPKLKQSKKIKSRIGCKICGKAFHANVSLVNHLEVHPKDVCGVCGDHFETEESFKIHLKTHVKAEICSICGKCFGASSSLEIHMRTHTGEKPFNCSECGKSFNCRHNMMRHIRIHTGEKPYLCTVCGKRFSDYSTLKRHLMVHVHEKSLEPSNANYHGNSNDSKEKINMSSTKKKNAPAICEVCGKTFHSMVPLVNHAKSHASNLCGVCGRRFDSDDSLNLHLKTHKNGKVCEVCGKCFDSQANLEMHMRIHTGEKPFLCNVCGKSFNCRHNMMRHIRTHTGEKPYRCKVCDQCFSDHSSLKQHSSSHTGGKPHQCEVCGKGFLRKTYVQHHMKSHATNKSL